ncbi:hypothetical protein B1L11_44945 [Microbispora sp. GKU 823]|nr:hypothetical protein B1L11_44945 [Microbispora sp. GKU 823]
MWGEWKAWLTVSGLTLCPLSRKSSLSWVIASVSPEMTVEVGVLSVAMVTVSVRWGGEVFFGGVDGGHGAAGGGGCA